MGEVSRLVRSLMVLGAALAGTAGVSVAVPSAVTATPDFTASAYPTQVTGSNFIGNEKFTTEAGAFECNTHFISHSVSGATSTLTVTGEATECEAFGGLFSATVIGEECAAVLHSTEKISAGTYRSHIDLSCPTGQSIKLAAATCKLEVKAQTGLTTVQTTNNSGNVKVKPEVGGIAYTVTQDGFGCPFSGTGSKTGGTYTGEVTVSRVGGGSIEISGE